MPTREKVEHREDYSDVRERWRGVLEDMINHDAGQTHDPEELERVHRIYVKHRTDMDVSDLEGDAVGDAVSRGLLEEVEVDEGTETRVAPTEDVVEVEAGVDTNTRTSDATDDAGGDENTDKGASSSGSDASHPRRRASRDDEGGGGAPSDVSYESLYFEALSRTDDNNQSPWVPHDVMVGVFEDNGMGAHVVEALDSYGSEWTVWSPDDTSLLYAYTPDLAGDTSDERARMASLLEEAGVGTERFIDVLDGQKASFDTGNYRHHDDEEITGNYGIKGGRGDGDGMTLVDVDVDDYDTAKESNPRIEALRDGGTLACTSTHTDRERPGHLYVAVDGDASEAVRDVTGREQDNLTASFGEVRIEEQYVVGPGSEVVCPCERCQQEDAPGHLGTYEIVNERPPTVWTLEEFRSFLEDDPGVSKTESQQDRETEPVDIGVDTDTDTEVSSSDRADGTGTISADARLSLALDVDEYVSDAVTDASNPDDRSKADAALARAVAPWLVYDEKAISDVLDRHGTSKWENRDDESYRTSVLSHALDRRTDTTAYEKVPYWALRELALRDGLVDTSELVERQNDDGSDTYLSFPDAEAYNRTLEHAREKYDLELDRSDVATDTRRGKPEAVLPEIEHEEIKTLGLVHGDGDVVRQAYDAVEETVRDAVTEYEWRGLVEAIPGLGKTRNVVKTAAETDENVTILTERHDLYDQVEEFAEKFGATVEVLPNFFDECPTANGTHGTEWARRIKELYRANATGADIHTFANPPCQEDGTCPYSTAWDRIDDDADIYVGNYVHAHVDIVGHSRTFVFDEFPGESFITKLSGEKMKAAVTAYVEETPLPFEDYTDVIEKRDTDDVEETVREYFGRKEAFLTDTERAVYDDDFHAYAPAVVYGLVTAEGLGNGFEQASVNKEGITSVVHNRENTAVYVHTAPEFGKHTRGVVCLDGTPTHEMWETVLDTRLRHERVLETTEARKAYLREGMGYSVVQTTEYTKPYSSGRNVNVSKDTALLKSIRRKHGQEVDLITTLSARKKYPGDGREVDIDGVGAQKHHSAFKGSNDLEKSRLGAVVGSPHYGDSYIKKWGALMGEAVERNENKGKGLSYGETGNKILQHMREHETAQAVLRFNRDGRGGVVYVATSALPEWIPTEWKPDSKTKDVVRRTRSDAEREVMRLVTDEGAVPTRELSDAVDVGMRQVRNITQNLEDDGLVNRVRRGRGHEHEPTDKTGEAVKEASVVLPDVDATPSTATSPTLASGDEVAQNPDALEEVSETDTASDVSTKSEIEANTETDMSEGSADAGRRSVTVGGVEPQPQHHPDGHGRVVRDTSTDSVAGAVGIVSVSTDMPALFEVVEAQVEEVVVEPG